MNVGSIGSAGSAGSSAAAASGGAQSAEVTPSSGAAGVGEDAGSSLKINSSDKSNNTTVNNNVFINNFDNSSCSMSTEDFTKLRGVSGAPDAQEMQMDLQKLLELLIMMKLLEAFSQGN